MVDVGAQIGLWTIPYAKQGWKVIAYEASPDNYTNLVKKIEPMGLSVELVNKAVSDSDQKEVKFYYSSEFIGVNSLRVNHKVLSRDKFAVVEQVRLDTDLESLGIEAVDFLKTDIEGADLLALKGFNFEKHKPSIIVSEYGKRSRAFGYGVRELVAHGEDHGYIAFLSSWESAGAWKVGEAAVEHKLLYWGDDPDYSQLNWGDVVFVAPSVLDIFKNASTEFYDKSF